MARRGVMTALQAALAGIGGAAGGYVQQEELKRKRRAEEEARTRQEMRDIVEAGERGFVTGEQLAQQQEQGKRTTGSVVQNALLSALSPRAGMLPPPTAQDVGTASQALATAGRAPQRIMTAGGQEMFRAETPQQESLRLALLKEERDRMGKLEERRYEQTFAADEARRRREERREERQEITPYQQAQLRLDEQRIALMQDKAKDESWEAKLPVQAQTKLAGYNASLDQIKSLRAAVKANPKAVGLKNYIPGAMIDIADPQGSGVRAQVEGFAGEIRNQRFGGQLTQEESRRSRQFLPDVSQRPEVILSRIDEAERFLEQKRKGLYSVYRGEYRPYISSADIESGGETLSAADRLRRGGY